MGEALAAVVTRARAEARIAEERPIPLARPAAVPSATAGAPRVAGRAAPATRAVAARVLRPALPQWAARPRAAPTAAAQLDSSRARRAASAKSCRLATPSPKAPAMRAA